MDSNIRFFMSHVNLENTTVPLHNHNCYELVYYVTGEGSTTFDGAKKAYKANTFSILTPLTDHSEFSKSETSTMFLGFTFDSIDLKPTSNLYEDKSKKIFNLLESIKREYEEKKSHYNLKVQLLVMEILIEIHRIENKRDLRNFNEFVNIIDYIDENVTTTINLKDLAKSYNMSYDRFRHLFKEIVGVAPNRYITMGKLNYSIVLLKTTNMTITDIAMQSGFSDAARYSVVFKKFFCTTPQAYRNKILKNDEK